MSVITTRKMQPNDWPSVAEIYKQGIKTGNATFTSDVPAYDEWDTSHLQDCRLVAVVGDAVMGWVALSPVSSRCVYAGVAEISIYISEKHRGQKVGEQLLNALIEESERAGYWSLRAGIFRENIASVVLHHKCGFRTVGYFERIGRDKEGKWRDNLLLERRSLVIGMDGE